MTALITTDLVALDADLGGDKDAVVRRLAGLVAGAGRATGADALHARRHGPRGPGPDRPPGRDRHPPLPFGGRHPGLARLRAAVPEGRLRRPGRPGRPRLPHRRTRPRRRRPPHAADRTGPGARPARVRRVPAGRVVGRGRRAPRRRGRLPRARRSAGRDGPGRSTGRDRPGRSPRRRGRPAQRGRRDRLPHGDRAHLHGRGQTGRRGEGSRGRHTRRDAGVVRFHAPGPGGHPGGRRGDLRGRRRRQGPGALRRQAGRPVRHEAGDQRARRHDPRGSHRRGRPECPPGCRHRRRRLRTVRSGQAEHRRGDPSLAAHRRELHDPVRRRRWAAHRAGLPAGRLPGRAEQPRHRRPVGAGAGSSTIPCSTCPRVPSRT